MRLQRLPIPPSLLAVALLGLAASPGSAATATMARPPDVVVMVFPGQYYPSDGISFTYSGAVGQEANSDLQTIASLAGWRPRNVKTTTNLARPGEPARTAVECQVDGAVDWKAGALPIEPYIVAFRRFGLIQVNFLFQTSFPFRGLRSLSTDQVDIGLHALGATYSYTVSIKKHDFERLNLPLIVPT